MFRMAIALVCLVSIGGIGCDDRDDGAATSDGGGGAGSTPVAGEVAGVGSVMNRVGGSSFSAWQLMKATAAHDAAISRLYSRFASP